MTDIEETTIAIIDDDSAVLSTLGRILRSAGYGVVLYASAMDMIEKNHYDDIDCMVLDLRLPDLSGLQFQDILNALGITIPIIFITGYASVWTEQTALKKGAAAFLHKPFNEQELLEAVQHALNG